LSSLFIEPQNKNKSKNVQKYVATVAQQAKQQVKQKTGMTPEENAAKKKAMKAAKKAQEEELAALFGEALEVGKKNKGAGANAGKMGELEPVAVEDKPKQVQETIIIEEGERTIEDIIEEERAKLLAQGKTGTPVNEESFAKWKAERTAKRKEEERRIVEREIAKKGKSKGLSVLSGRALFDYDASLFKDDEAAAGAEETNQREERDYDDEEECDKTASAADMEVQQESLFLDEGDDDALDDLDSDED
jgi:hypothetical protein